MTIPDYDEKTHCSHCGSKLQLISEEQHNIDVLCAFGFQREPHTIGKSDQWTILAIRMLAFMDREDVADGLDQEIAQLER